jgi:hypothetical protein
MWTRREDLRIRKHPPEIAARLIARPLAVVRDWLTELTGAPKPVYTRRGRTTPRPRTPKEDEPVLTRPPSEFVMRLQASLELPTRKASTDSDLKRGQ